MSNLTASDVQKIAELSKLDLPADKLSMITERLGDILKLVDKMDAVNTQNIEPLAHPFHVTQPMREDTVTEKDQRESFQKNSPYVEAGLYIVPKFVEE